MAHHDRRGLPVTTRSDAAAAHDRAGIDLLLAAWPGAAEALDAAIAADPDFALPYAARARLHAMRAESAAAQDRITRAAACVARAGTERERSHVVVLSLAIDGRSGPALARPLAHLESWRVIDVEPRRPDRRAPLPAATGTGNVLRLALAQALAGANSVVVYATGAVIGSRLAPDPALATLPISIFVVGMAACTLPAGRIARAHGRRAAFLAGTGCGVLVGLLSALALVLSSFWIFCLATFFGGAYAAVVLSFRFAAADCVAPERRPRALSAVMAGGVFAGIIGPQLVSHTMDLWPAHAFAATFLAQAAVAALSAVVLMGVRLPGPTQADRSGGRPLSLIARQPRFITAVLCGWCPTF